MPLKLGDWILSACLFFIVIAHQSMVNAIICTVLSDFE